MTERRRAPRRPTQEVGADLIAALMTGRKSWPDVILQAGLGKSTEAAWYTQLRATGVLRISGYTKPQRQGGKWTRLYSLQAPFAEEDAPHPGLGQMPAHLLEAA